ncbi:ADP-heptose:LPS heptosyltransferase [Mucilaginibacter sp. SG538B]|uniref:glycosyltransferase family 9 protein n=1 Tax=unclassified Mucilaginibacter TaxID=2617802 RepID=UPI0008712292|nr:MULTISPECIES: glycosyltransferase family 9 protein [unclassified Mucilaginibacter]NVM66387.1 ADP-heptose:LPS heptosyltransferase [Mucilaginibacter sp. SG538B]SCW64048.1 ADP-heptose:LPS heptosyltransferase [Mucilaginibacter sp. NFR10]
MFQFQDTEAPHILISRVDAIGDVVLTLPVASYLKQLFPGAKVSFLGRTYTQPVINAMASIDAFVNYDELKTLPDTSQIEYLQKQNIDAVIHVLPNKHIARIAKQAGIKLRIGTTNRVFHWYTCNKLVKLSRKKSDLHESQLNLVLLKPLGLEHIPSLPGIIAHDNFQNNVELTPALGAVLVNDKFNLIIHPKSHGSGMEWGLDNFAELINNLPPDKFNIIITGSENEKALLANWIKTLPTTVRDMTGQMSLGQLIAFISKAGGLIASGTGPLHLAALTGINTLGLFPSLRPIHPGRWAPVGKKAGYIESGTNNLETITPFMVAEQVKTWL